jgi:hypothetical protein
MHTAHFHSSVNEVTPVCARMLQRKHNLSDGSGNLSPPTAVSRVPPIVNEVLRSAGQPLDAETRAFMEPRFGHDFSDVRVHADSKATESARAVNALAYTVGTHVAVRSDKHAPGTAAGRLLLAHELAHVVQQSAGRAGSDPESRADAAARRIVGGQQVNSEILGAAAVGLYRQEEELDPDWFLKLSSLTTQLEAISIQSAIRSSHTKKGMFPPISANSALLSQSGPSFSMRSEQEQHPINLGLKGETDKQSKVPGINLGGVSVSVGGIPRSDKPGHSFDDAQEKTKEQEGLTPQQWLLNKLAKTNLALVLRMRIQGKHERDLARQRRQIKEEEAER